MPQLTSLDVGHHSLKPKELDMSATQRSEAAIETPKPRTLDMKLEIVVIPVSDVDRAKRFYGGLGWRLDADFAAGDDFRVIQLTPPGSGVLGHLRQKRHRGGAGLRQGPIPDRLRHRGRSRRVTRSRRRNQRGVPRCRRS